MAFSLALHFNTVINISTQVGDMVYYTPVSTIGVSSTAYSTGSTATTIQLGKITEIVNPNLDDGNHSVIKVLCELVDANGDPLFESSPLMQGSFITFSKDKTANTTSLIGYYMEVKFVNKSRGKVELFSVGAELSESSK